MNMWGSPMSVDEVVIVDSDSDQERENEVG